MNQKTPISRHNLNNDKFLELIHDPSLWENDSYEQWKMEVLCWIKTANNISLFEKHEIDKLITYFKNSTPIFCKSLFELAILKSDYLSTKSVKLIINLFNKKNLFITIDELERYAFHIKNKKPKHSIELRRILSNANISNINIPNINIPNRSMSDTSISIRSLSNEGLSNSSSIGNKLSVISGYCKADIPKFMKVGKSFSIEAKIGTKEIFEYFEYSIDNLEKIIIATFMKAKIVGDEDVFSIQQLTNENQFYLDSEFTMWKWKVIPKKSGLHSLSLIVSIRNKDKDTGEEMKDYPVLEKEIKIKINPVYSTTQFINKNWKWIITTILGSGVLWEILKNILNQSK